jgi:hypothetical protein
MTMMMMMMIKLAFACASIGSVSISAGDFERERVRPLARYQVNPHELHTECAFLLRLKQIFVESITEIRQSRRMHMGRKWFVRNHHHCCVYLNDFASRSLASTKQLQMQCVALLLNAGRGNSARQRQHRICLWSC